MFIAFVSHSFLNPEPQTLLSELNQRMGPQFAKLNKSLIELVSLKLLKDNLHLLFDLLGSFSTRFLCGGFGYFLM